MSSHHPASTRPRLTCVVHTIVVSAAGLGLVACGTAGLGTDAPSAADRVTEALEQRLDRGFTASVALEVNGDTADIEELDTFMQAQADEGLLDVSVSPDGVPTAGNVGDSLEFRWVDNTDLYVRVDPDDMAAWSGMPDQGDNGTDQPAVMPNQLFGPEIAQALNSGNWVGITNVPDTVSQMFNGGQANGQPSGLGSLGTSVDEETKALLEDYDLAEVEAFIATYGTVTGDGPWEITIDTLAVREALEQVATQSGQDLEELTESELAMIPDEVTGITVTAEDGVATQLRWAVADAIPAEAADHDELTTADPEVVVTLSDYETTIAPEDAAILDLESLMQSGVGS